MDGQKKKHARNQKFRDYLKGEKIKSKKVATGKEIAKGGNYSKKKEKEAKNGIQCVISR